MGCGPSKRSNVITYENSPHKERDDDNIKVKDVNEGNTRSKNNVGVAPPETPNKESDNKINVNDVNERNKRSIVEVYPPETSIHKQNNTLENVQTTGSRPTAVETQLVLYRESCKAFPRPPPPPDVEKVDQDEFFSPEVKAIYPGFEAVVRLDEHVNKTPTALKQNIHKLVEYLMQVTSTEYDKARVVIRWVATNIAYDIGYLTTGEYTSSSGAQDVLATGIGVCAGFSNLVLEMCRLCNLHCEKITGIAKGSGYSIGDNLANGEHSKKFRHAWNRIKISDTWFLCDATWASGYTKRVNGKYTFMFHWKEEYFLTPPGTLCHSHMPDDSTFAMVDDPVNVQEWTKQARIYPAGCLYKIYSVDPSPNQGCIKTDSSRVELAFRSTYNMALRYTLINDSTDEHVDNSIACITNGNTSTLLVRLPRAGFYRVVLFGEPVCLSERSKKVSRGMLMSFNIHSTCGSGSLPFPVSCHILGSLPAFTDGGFKSSVTVPIIETRNGCTQFTIQRPGGEQIRFNFRDENGSDLKEYVFADAYPEKVIFNIRCPKKGEYSLVIFARLSDDQVNKDQFKPGATYLILNKNEQEMALLPYLPIVQWGPTDKLSNLEIALNPTTGSEIICNREETYFELSFNEEQIDILYSMKTKNDVTENKWVYAETRRRGQLVNLKFRFRVPLTGFYEFNVFAGKVGEKTKDFIGRWLVNVIKPYEGDTFAFNKKAPWGPNATKMLANELKIISENSSTIYPSDAKSDLVIASTKKRKTGIIFNLKTGLDTALNECVLADSLQQNDETILYKFTFHPPESGFYCFNLFGSSGDHVGSWLVDARKSGQLRLPENDTRPWGPVQTFFDYGFSVVQPDSAIISTSLETKSTLTLTTDPSGSILGRLHFHNEKEDIKDGFDIACITDDEHRKRIDITFKLTKKGYYKFSLFISNTGQKKFDYGGGWLLHCA